MQILLSFALESVHYLAMNNLFSLLNFKNIIQRTIFLRYILDNNLTIFFI